MQILADGNLNVLYSDASFYLWMSDSFAILTLVVIVGFKLLITFLINNL